MQPAAAMASQSQSESQRSPAEHAKLVGGTSSWLVCSIGMLVFNKMAVQYVPLPCVLVAAQMGVTVLAMLIFRWRTLHIGSMRDVARWCMVVPFFLGMLLTSIFALKHAPMSLVVTFRALSPLVSLVIERLCFNKPPEGSLISLWPLVVIVMGAALYARDVKRSAEGMEGIGWVLLNTVMALGDRLLQRRFLAQNESPVDISTCGVTLLNNSLAMVPLFFIGYGLGEFDKVPGVMASLDGKGWFFVVASCAVGVGISYTGILVQSLITATSFLVLVNANKFVIILLEVNFMASGKILTYNQLLGAFLAIVGSIMWGIRGKEEEIKRWLGLASSDSKNRGSAYGAVAMPNSVSEKIP